MLTDGHEQSFPIKVRDLKYRRLFLEFALRLFYRQALGVRLTPAQGGLGKPQKKGVNIFFSKAKGARGYPPPPEGGGWPDPTTHPDVEKEDDYSEATSKASFHCRQKICLCDQRCSTS